MALTEIPIELSSTPGIVDNSNATAITIDASENVGIGVVPSAWSSSSTALQIGSLALEDYTVSGANVSNVLNNAFRNGSGNVVYIESDFASSYGQYNGEHLFNVAASGTAGDTISFTRAMTINASGNVGIGTDSPTTFSGYLTVHQKNASGDAIHLIESDGGIIAQTISNDSSGTVTTGSRSNHSWRVTTNDVERMRIDSSGNVKIGDSATDLTSKLVVSGNADANVATFMYDGAAGTFLDFDLGGANGDVTLAADARSGSYPPMVFKTGATERLRIDASGNLGIGVVPLAHHYKSLEIGNAGSQITGRTAADTYFMSGLYWSGASTIKYAVSSVPVGYYNITNGVHVWSNAPSGTAGNDATITAAMVLDASGNLLLNTTANAGGYKFRFNGVGAIGDTDSALKLGRLNADAVFLQGTSDASVAKAIAFMGTSEYGRFDTSGNLLVGTTNNSQSTGDGTKIKEWGSVQVVNNSSTGGGDAFSYYSSAGSNYRFWVNGNGLIAAISSSIQSLSDQRFKENIRDLDDGLSKVMQLKPRKFDWKEGKGADTKDARGFIAQEFEEVFPDLIGEWKDPAPEGEEPYKSVSQDLIPTLVKAIQEQQATIEALTARIAALES